MRKKNLLLCAGGTLFLGALLFGVLVRKGIVFLNNPSRETYPIRGADVSSYQGEIDWDMLASQGLSFVFIKATEGSSFVDPSFKVNADGARKTGLRVDAYHFFSYDSTGETQAENFMAAAGKFDGMLPPVIDVEFYGGWEKNPPARADVQEQLGVIITRLEAYYGRKPVLYATEKSYAMYLSGAFPGCDIWIRNVFTGPTLADGRAWTFWQYTDRARLNGYRGKEPCIDLDVFSGTAEEFAAYGLPRR